MIISLIVWLVVGFIAGYLAKLIMPGPDGGGVLATILLGIVGAIVGGWVGRMLFESPAHDGFSIMGLVFAVIGALIVLAIYRLATGRSLRA
ncbi:MAG: putative rane protein [Acidobacteria bacterium]|jgi:uncharacterized membrane protein YeaQ/YmgE (transglycosylase-associated protein family)|nr:putative rane protein [Acidobacteriota bacterium]